MKYLLGLMLIGFMYAAKAEEVKTIVMCDCGVPVIVVMFSGEYQQTSILEKPTPKAYAVCAGKDRTALAIEIHKISKKACPVNL